MYKMKCKKCKKNIPDNSKFCNHCGAKQKNEKLYRRKDGLYEKIIVINGKRVAFRAKTEKEVFKKIAEYQEKGEKGPLFKEVAEQWYGEHWDSLAYTTQRGYKYAFEEINEHFGNMYISEITHKHINNYIKALPKSLAKKTCKNRLSVLNMIFKLAVVEDYITNNPCSYITIPKDRKQSKRRAPTNSEIEIIKKNTNFIHRNFPVGLLAYFLLYTGCRRGEALALRYNNIDRERARLIIDRSIYYKNNKPYIKEPKSDSGLREIIIPKKLLNLIPQGNLKDYVFSSDPTEPAKQSHFEYAWKAYQKETGLTLTAHQLRHGYATLLHEADIDVKDAQDLLGHADIATTQNIYTEVSDKRKNITEQKLNNYLQ
jgi:integrase